MEGPCRDDRCRLTLARTVQQRRQANKSFLSPSRPDKSLPLAFSGYILHSIATLAPPSFVHFLLLLLLPLPISPFFVPLLPCRTESRSPRKSLPFLFLCHQPFPYGNSAPRWNSSGTRIEPMRRQDEIDRKDHDDIDDE